MSIISMFPGGAIMPANIESGTNIIYTKPGVTVSERDITPYANVGAGYGFTAKKAGTYRINFVVETNAGGYFAAPGWARLTKNNVEVPSSETYATAGNPVLKSIDVSLVANDVIRLQFHGDMVDSGSNEYESSAVITHFSVSIVALELDSEVKTILVPV